jgi:hypothetical protein
MELLLAIGVGLGACWLVAHIVTLVVAIRRRSMTQAHELRHLQGSASNIFRGQLHAKPPTCDYRFIQGLEWNVSEKKFKAQSRLSNEAIRAVFFQ